MSGCISYLHFTWFGESRPGENGAAFFVGKRYVRHLCDKIIGNLWYYDIGKSLASNVFVFYFFCISLLQSGKAGRVTVLLFSCEERHFMNIIDIKIDELNPYENNPRKNDEAVKYVAESIRQFGFKVPIVVDGDNTIIAGHTRFKAARMLNLEDVPCIVADDLTPEQIKAFRLADNKVSEKAEWDFDLLEDELADILDINMEDLGFDFFEKDTKVVDDNYDKPAPKNPRSKLGDVFQLGRHHLMCDDSTDSGDVDTLMNGLQADMLLTDPPYNVDYEGSAGKIENDNMEDSVFRDFLTRAFFNAKSHMKPGGAFHVWHADSEGYNFRGALQDAGFKIRQCLITSLVYMARIHWIILWLRNVMTMNVSHACTAGRMGDIIGSRIKNRPQFSISISRRKAQSIQR